MSDSSSKPPGLTSLKSLSFRVGDFLERSLLDAFLL